MAEKVVANPYKKEQTEKTSVAGNKTFRFEPIRSDNELKSQPEIAHAIDSPATINPKSAFVKFKSGLIKGNKYTILNRFMKTIPKRKNIIKTTAVS